MLKDKDIIQTSDVLLNSTINDTENITNNDISYKNACEEIANEILTLDIRNSTSHIKKEIFKIIKNKSLKYKLSKIPKNVDIFKLLPEGNHFKDLLKLKPSKTSSGIAVITVMPMPFACPHGKCIYCPGGVDNNTPLSYIGTEPVTKIAQQVNYDPFRQVWTKVIQLIERGHNVDKAELVIVGGTFPFYPKEYQKNFVKKCYDAFNLFNTKLLKNDGFIFDLNHETLSKNLGLSDRLEKSKEKNEKAGIRCVGLTIETKPDYCKKEHVDMMLELGTTRIEIGVQSLNDEVFKAVNRGHNLNDVYESFYLAKNSGYKITAHMMPGLPKSSMKQDISDFNKLFDDQRLKPDMLKIYPTVVIKNTGLYKLYKEKKYTSYSTNDLVSILVDIKKIVPPWVRIMRIQREIEPNDVISGPKIGNLRQLVSLELKKQGVKCKCIRCREIGLKDTDKEYSHEDLTLFRTDYLSSDGKEIFLSFESKDKENLFGFLRLRIMSYPQRKELIDTEENNAISSSTHSKAFQSAIVRELHVYGPLVKIGSKSTEYRNNLKRKESSIYQHKGLGQNLLKEAEKICREEFNIKKLSVISAIGTREYYKKFGYVINGPYVTKAI